MLRPSLLVWIVGAALSSGSGLTQSSGPSSPKIELLDLAPAEQRLEYYLTPRGGHFAAIIQRGSRFAVTYDGTAGPPFDEILADGNQRRVQFSPDHTRYAYVGRAAQEYVVMVDGKELVRLPVATTRWHRTALGNLPPTFTGDSKHTYFAVQSGPDGLPGQRDLLYVDAQVVPSGLVRIKSLAVSVHGRTAQVVMDHEERQAALVVDGKPAGYLGTDPRFTADGARLLTRFEQPGKRGVIIYSDGKPWIRAENAALHFAPTGSNVVAVVSRISPTFQQYVVVGNQRVEASVAQQITNVTFSPDGSRYAAECQSPVGTRFFVVDGKKELEYQTLMPVPAGDGLTTFQFSPDSKRYLYMAQNAGKIFIVVDGQESDGYNIVHSLSFSADSKHVGFAAMGSGSSMVSRFVSVDGKVEKKDVQVLRHFAFSPDGSRYAYVAGTNAAPRLFVDGVEDARTSCCQFNAEPLAPAFVFSPDGRHVVHFSAPSENPRGFVFNGRLVRPPSGGSSIYNPSFSPDGRHFYWLQLVPTGDARGSLATIFVNGRQAFQTGWGATNLSLLTKTPGAWEIDRAGVLTLIAQVGETLKRVRITPAADTSVETFIGSAR
jgi:Tol biopolymer transport system component